MSHSIKNSTPRPNIDIYQINENNDEYYHEEKDLTNLYLEE